MLRIALTGGIATGKTYVRRRLASHGVPTIDADALARDAVAPGTPGLDAVVARFGPGVLKEDGSLDRRALGAIVFKDPDARRDLEAIVHPVVRSAWRAWLDGLAARGDVAFAVADIPLLYETGADAEFDRVIVTTCPPSQQVARIVERDGLSEEEARARVASQWPLEEKVRRADYVIDTGGTFGDTNRQIDRTVEKLLELAVSS
ncbi:MAG TPA: dephospho-CoA kinase [Vicinamibacterales bacterium]